MNAFEQAARRLAAQGKGGFRPGGPLAGALAIGGPESVVRDRFGKVLKVGDLVLHRPVHDLVFQVVAVERASAMDPKRDPRDPTMVVVLEIAVPLELPPNRPAMNIVTIGHMEPPKDEGTGDGAPMPDADQGGVGGTEPGDTEPSGTPGTPAVDPAEPPATQVAIVEGVVAPGGAPGPETLG